MSESTRGALLDMMRSIRERLTEVMAAIDEGVPYFETTPWPDDVTPDDDGLLCDDNGLPWLDADGAQREVDDFRDDGRDPGDFLAEYPLEVIDERGRNFAVVLGVGGPHIEIEADGQRDAVLRGYWGGEEATMYGDVFNRVLDWFIDR